jgi:hypothetical protein
MRRLLLLGLAILLPFVASPSALAQGPELKLLEPANGAQIPGSTIRIVFQVAGVHIVPSTVPLDEAGKHPEVNKPGEGHLHFMLDLQPLVVWEQETPYSFTNVASGPHLLTVEVVQNDHSSFKPPVIAQVKLEVGGTAANTAATGLMPNTGFGDGGGHGSYGLLLVLALALMGSGIIVRRWAGVRRGSASAFDDTTLLEQLILAPPPFPEAGFA